MEKRIWPEYVPQGSINWLMGRVHVSTPDSEIAADITGRLKGNKNATPEMIADCVEYALHCHRENQALYQSVVTGRF